MPWFSTKESQIDKKGFNYIGVQQELGAITSWEPTTVFQPVSGVHLSNQA
jgi:hypothetical protein